jgi:hypothetical protein
MNKSMPHAVVEPSPCSICTVTGCDPDEAACIGFLTGTHFSTDEQQTRYFNSLCSEHQKLIRAMGKEFYSAIGTISEKVLS